METQEMVEKIGEMMSEEGEADSSAATQEP
jgi:hypothetical protein